MGAFTHALLHLWPLVLLLVLAASFSELRKKNRRRQRAERQQDDYQPWRDDSDKFRRSALLTDTELAFYGTLSAALPRYRVFPQVAMGALLQPRSGSYTDWNRIGQQRVDFVIYDLHGADVIAVVELDDPSHDIKLDRDRQRDDRLTAAGYRVLRWTTRSMPSAYLIAAAIADIAGTASRSR